MAWFVDTRVKWNFLSINEKYKTESSGENKNISSSQLSHFGGIEKSSITLEVRNQDNIFKINWFPQGLLKPRIFIAWGIDVFDSGISRILGVRLGLDSQTRKISNIGIHPDEFLGKKYSENSRHIDFSISYSSLGHIFGDVLASVGYLNNKVSMFSDIENYILEKTQGYYLSLGYQYGYYSLKNATLFTGINYRYQNTSGYVNPTWYVFDRFTVVPNDSILKINNSQHDLQISVLGIRALFF